MIDFDDTNITYTPLFCEENIWKLAQLLHSRQQAIPLEVLFIINNSNSVALFNQKRSIAQLPAIWDYHVILLTQLCDKYYIFDLDSKCRLPEEINRYFELTFPSNIKLNGPYRPMIRSIKAAYFLDYFTSDRQHMRGIIPDNQFPDYEIIKPSDNNNKLLLETCRDINCSIAHSQLDTPADYLRKTVMNKSANKR